MHCLCLVNMWVIGLILLYSIGNSMLHVTNCLHLKCSCKSVPHSFKFIINSVLLRFDPRLLLQSPLRSSLTLILLISCTFYLQSECFSGKIACLMMPTVEMESRVTVTTTSCFATWLTTTSPRSGPCWLPVTHNPKGEAVAKQC